MTATMLAQDARRNVALFTLADGISFKPKLRFAKKDNGSGQEADILVIEDLPVFRSGTFRDSMGFQHTWEDIHMDQMVSHFDLLRNRGILKDVPTRKGHGALFGDPIDNVIGWHTGLRAERRTNQVDGQEYLYLLANFEVLDADAIQKISSGLWRNVSSEVGSWITNNETEFWPVYQGVAYVDFSAVEGLSQFSNHQGVGSKFSIMLNTDEEIPVTQPHVAPATVPAVPTGPAPTAQPAPAVQQFSAAELSRMNHKFTVNGQEVSDFAAVQAHITNLENAAAETKANNRKNFIKGLAEGSAPKILATQIEGIEAYALKMDDASWEAFEKSWNVVSATPILGNHTAGNTGNQGQPTGTPQQNQNDEVSTLEGIIKQHRMGKMSQTALENTASFKKLKQLKPDSPLLVG